MIKYYTPEEIGLICKYYRKVYTTYTQLDVGEELFYTQQAIGQFERGISDTARIFQWYVLHGLNKCRMDEIYAYLKNEKKL